MVIHRFRLLYKASDLKNLRQILCCNVKYLTVPVPGYGHWWIFMCEQSSCINCSMTGCLNMVFNWICLPGK